MTWRARTVYYCIRVVAHSILLLLVGISIYTDIYIVFDYILGTHAIIKSGIYNMLMKLPISDRIFIFYFSYAYKMYVYHRKITKLDPDTPVKYKHIFYYFRIYSFIIILCMFTLYYIVSIYSQHYVHYYYVIYYIRVTRCSRYFILA